MEDVQQSSMIFLPDPAEAAQDVLDFAAGHRGIGCPHCGHAGMGTRSSHEMDGTVAYFWTAAVTGAAEGPDGQPVFAPTVPPVGKRGISEAELLGGVFVSESKLASPLVEGDCAAAAGALHLSPLTLSRPAALGRSYCDTSHGFFTLRLLYRSDVLPPWDRRRFLDGWLL